VLVLGSLELDHDEGEAREGAELLLDHEPISAARPFTSASAHAQQQLALPLCLLLPNPRAHAALLAVRMELVVDIVHALHGAGQGDWTAGFHALSRADLKKATVRGGLGAHALDEPTAKRGADEQSALVHRYLVVRGARARSSMLGAYEAARVVRVDELEQALRDAYQPPRTSSGATASPTSART
jgi:hypothetical protein